MCILFSKLGLYPFENSKVKTKDPHFSLMVIVSNKDPRSTYGQSIRVINLGLSLRPTRVGGQRRSLSIVTHVGRPSQGMTDY